MHKFYAFILSFLLVGMSTVGSYARATTGNAAVDTVIRVEKSIFATVATGLAASALVGIKAKELYDDNKQAVYDKALDAYDAMSANAKESWAAAVARGRTGADMVSDFWDSLVGIFDDVFKNDSFDTSIYYDVVVVNGVKQYSALSPYRFKISYADQIYNVSSLSVKTNAVSGNTMKLRVVSSTVNFDVYSTNLIATNDLIHDYDNRLLSADYFSLSGVFSALSPLYVPVFSVYNTLTNDDVVYDYNPIYDQALTRLKETDIPRMKDAGMVLPQVDVRTPAGTRVNYDAQAGTVTLPDGSIYNGDLVAGNIPDAVIKDGDIVWHDVKTNTDTNIWDGSITDSITGDTVPDVGENAGTAEGEAGAVDAGDLPAETDIENVPSRGIVWTPLVQSAQDLTERFPFSIPWDLQRMLSIFNTDPETPKFDIDIKKYVEIDGKTMGMKWTLDFSFLDPLAAVGRWFLIIVFDIAMILGIRKIMPE